MTRNDPLIAAVHEAHDAKRSDGSCARPKDQDRDLFMRISDGCAQRQRDGNAWHDMLVLIPKLTCIPMSQSQHGQESVIMSSLRCFYFQYRGSTVF